MGETAIAQKSVDALASYAELRRRVRETLLWGQQAVEEARVRTYWETGWWIQEHILLNRYRARYGEEVLRKLSRDEAVSESVLDRCKQFSEKFPDLFPKPISAGRQKLVLTPYPALRNGIKSQLTWTHYRTLLPLEDDKLRRRLVRQAARHGFASYWNLSGEEAKKFREGDIVRKPPGGEMEKLTEGSKSLLYTYEAEVTRVVDGDTIWMKIYLEGRGRPPWVKEKLRLRDIDAPELKTPEGRAAKKFVEEEVQNKRILITTTKPDKWDRYLSDIFLTSASGEDTYLNNLLLETGHARLKTDWSLDDWEA